MLGRETFLRIEPSWRMYSVNSIALILLYCVRVEDAEAS